MKKDLVQNRPQYIAISLVRHSVFYSLRDCAAKTSGRSRMLREDLLSDFRRHGRGRCHGCSVRAHDLASERLLLVGDLDHIDLAVQLKISACHGERRSPLSGSGLCSHAAKALLFCVVSLRDRGIQLVRARCVVSLELIIDLCRRVELLLKAVRADER